jgi:hypothetical protein
LAAAHGFNRSNQRDRHLENATELGNYFHGQLRKAGNSA